MKRLENDGAKITIGSQNQELLYSSRDQEAKNRDDFPKAIASDILGREVEKQTDVQKAL